MNVPKKRSQFVFAAGMTSPVCCVPGESAFVSCRPVPFPHRRPALPAGCVLGLRRPPGTAAPGGVGAGARYPEQRFVCGHPPRPSSKTFPFLSVVPTCRLITPAQPAFPLAAATVGAGRPPLREPACCGLLSPAPGLLAGFVGPCGARRGAASPRGVRR
eukprot:XP_027311579.1 uncharacterized protein LOC113843443 isoform X4 [Anas platyrhynchos]